jgi:tRNA (guanine-N7-)-methyltransferase
MLTSELSQENIDSTEYQYRREIKSYVCRNRRLSAVNKQLIETYYPVWGLVNNADWDFFAIFNNHNPVIIEIGFGQGNTLSHNAMANPDINYIGIEVYRPGCINILNYIKQHKINNLRVCQGDAQFILANHIKKSSVAGLQIFFPDPWPKTKHHKRRLIQPEFINLIADKLIPGGFIHLATDWEPYAEHMVAVLESNHKFKDGPIMSSSHQRLLTRFEEKGIKRGHVIRDLIYKLED